MALCDNFPFYFNLVNTGRKEEGDSKAKEF